MLNVSVHSIKYLLFLKEAKFLNSENVKIKNETIIMDSKKAYNIGLIFYLN